MIKSLIIGTAALGLAACQGTTSNPEPTPVDPPQGGQLVPGAEEQLAAFSAKAVAAFRADGTAFRAGHLTHDVEVYDGFVEMTPHHVDDSDQRVTGGKLALRTSTIGTSDGSTLDGPITTRLHDGVVEIERGAAVEMITNRAEGVEQAWRFASRPGTAGDLTITVAALGQEFVADNASGLHFRSDKGLGFRYSDAVWVEANGKRWPIDARYENGAITMTVPEDVIANSTYPAVLDPTISAEVEVDAPVNGGVGTASTQATIAFDGTNYLVVWEDRRLSTDSDIFGSRVSASGTILDTNNILINASPGIQSHPVVTFAGGAFVVAWEDFKVEGGTEADIRAARVSTTGAVTQLGAVAATAASEVEPAIAGSGATAFLTWTVSNNIVGSLFNGTFGGIVTVAGTTETEIQSAVAGNGSGQFLVAWSEGVGNAGNIRGSIVSGGVAGAAFDIATNTLRQFDPAASFDGTNYVVAWTDTNGSLNISGGRVSQAGAPLDGLGGLPVTTAIDSQEQPDITCAASGCTVIWRERRNFVTTSFDVFAQRMTPTFTPNGAEISVTNAGLPQQAPAISDDGTNFFAIWHDERDARIKVVTGATISSGGAVGAANPIPRGNNREFNPAVGHAGNFHIVAWSDSRSNDSTGVEFVRFNNLTKLDTTSRTLSNAANAQSAPALSANGGTQLYAVWQDTRNGVDNDIFGSRINTDGTVTSSAGIPIVQATGDQLVPVVSSAGTGGTSALVVWQDRRGANFDIMGALLDAAGNVVLSDIVICNAAGDQTRPSAAYDPVKDQWIVVWSDARVAGNADIFGARVSLQGAVLDANGVAVSSAAGAQFRPTIAFTGSVFLAVWEDRRTDNQGDIFGARLQGGTALTVLDPNGIGIGGTTGEQSAPSVAQNVGSFLVAWQDGRNVATNGTDIFAIGIGTSGTVGEPEFAVAASTEDESSPAVGDSSAAKVSRIAYVKERSDLQTLRVVSRQITVAATVGNVCSQDSQCGAGGFCVDGRCCDSACGGTAVDCQACKGTLTGQPDGVCAPILAGKVCRPYADTFCDRQEKCDGSSIVCPDDLGRRQGITCNIAGGGTGTCPADDVTGAPHVCQ